MACGSKIGAVCEQVEFLGKRGSVGKGKRGGAGAQSGGCCGAGGVLRGWSLLSLSCQIGFSEGKGIDFEFIKAVVVAPHGLYPASRKHLFLSL